MTDYVVHGITVDRDGRDKPITRAVLRLRVGRSQRLAEIHLTVPELLRLNSDIARVLEIVTKEQK